MDSSTKSHPNAHLQYHYNYNEPPFRKVMLASVKESIYHPRLPTLRQMDRDTTMHRLPDEHSRTSTSCGPRDFANASPTLFQRARKPLSGTRITSTGRSLQKVIPEFTAGITHTVPENPYMLSVAKKNWSNFISATGEFGLPLYDPKFYRFSGYAVRYLKPEVVHSWQYTLEQEPKLDQFGKKPIPANEFSRYRDTFPQYSRNVSFEAWR